MADLDLIDPVTFLSGSTHNALIFHRRERKKKRKNWRQHRAAAAEKIHVKVLLLFKVHLGSRRVELFPPIAGFPLSPNCVGGAASEKKLFSVSQRAPTVLAGG